MKTNDEESTFVPVTLTIETEQELRMVYAAIGCVPIKEILSAAKNSFYLPSEFSESELTELRKEAFGLFIKKIEDRGLKGKEYKTKEC